MGHETGWEMLNSPKMPLSELLFSIVVLFFILFKMLKISKRDVLRKEILIGSLERVSFLCSVQTIWKIPCLEKRKRKTKVDGNLDLLSQECCLHCEEKWFQIWRIFLEKKLVASICLKKFPKKEYQYCGIIFLFIIYKPKLLEQFFEKKFLFNGCIKSNLSISSLRFQPINCL